MAKGANWSSRIACADSTAFSRLDERDSSAFHGELSDCIGHNRRDT